MGPWTRSICCGRREGCDEKVDVENVVVADNGDGPLDVNKESRNRGMAVNRTLWEERLLD